MKYLKMLAVIAAMAMTALGPTATSATTLEVAGTAQNSPVTLTATLAAGTSTLFEGTTGQWWETCKGSEFKATTEGSFTGSTVGGAIEGLSWSGCSHEYKVTNPGQLQIAWSKGTDGTVTVSETKFTLVSTTFGTTLECTTGPNADIGTLTGVGTGHASLDFNGVVHCSFLLPSMRMTGTYTITGPTGFGVVS